MKKYLFLILMLLTTCITFAQIDYRSLLVRDKQTFWATTTTLYHRVGNCVEAGMRFDQDGHFDKYSITDQNDTLSMYDGLDTEVGIAYRTYELQEDTLFIMEWYDYPPDIKGEKDAWTAYKILYISEQKMLTLELCRDKNGRWIESTYPPGHKLIVREYWYMNPSLKFLHKLLKIVSSRRQIIYRL